MRKTRGRSDNERKKLTILQYLVSSNYHVYLIIGIISSITRTKKEEKVGSVEHCQRLRFYHLPLPTTFNVKIHINTQASQITLDKIIYGGHFNDYRITRFRTTLTGRILAMHSTSIL